jgi:hypothetical protein
LGTRKKGAVEDKKTVPGDGVFGGHREKIKKIGRGENPRVDTMFFLQK